MKKDIQPNVYDVYENVVTFLILDYDDIFVIRNLPPNDCNFHYYFSDVMTIYDYFGSYSNLETYTTNDLVADWMSSNNLELGDAFRAKLNFTYFGWADGEQDINVDMQILDIYKGYAKKDD